VADILSGGINIFAPGQDGLTPKDGGANSAAKIRTHAIGIGLGIGLAALVTALAAALAFLVVRRRRRQLKQDKRYSTKEADTQPHPGNLNNEKSTAETAGGGGCSAVGGSVARGSSAEDGMRSSGLWKHNGVLCRELGTLGTPPTAPGASRTSSAGCVRFWGLGFRI
jgi:hypothetical protein